MSRQPGLDALRTNATVLVVATHVALSFMVTPVGWAIQDRSQHLGVDLCVWIMRAAGMPTFFWLSGYSSRAVLVWRGARGFAWNRITRIFVPLAVALVPCSLAINALWDWGREVGHRGTVADNIPKFQGSEIPIQLAHLWYLYYLLWMSIAAIALVRIVRGIRPPAGFQLLAIPATISTGALVFLNALHTNTPLGFVPDLLILGYMGAFFLWGWLVHARPDELARYGHCIWRALAIAAGLLVIVIVTLARGLAVVEAPPLYAIAASGLFTVAMIVFLLGVHVRYLSRPNRWLGFVSKSAYWCYVVHLPIVVGLQILLASVAIPGVIKYVTILAVTMLVCLASYATARRLWNRSRINAPHR
jgi:peptidoglycan/LPS O-acetylase OafA/YrhL